MKVIAVMNQKGGIGKTMTAAAVAYIIGEEWKNRVLIADADQQGNISQIYGQYDPEGIGMSELLEHHRSSGGKFSTEGIIKPTAYGMIDIIPSNGYLMRTNMNLLLKNDMNQITRFRNAIEEIYGAYDVCIADCGLQMDMTVINVLVTADYVIIPAKIGGFEIDAIQNTIEQIEDLRGLNQNVKTKVLFTMRQRNKTTDQVEEWLREKSGYRCFRTAVRRSVIAERSTIAREPLPKFSRRSIASEDYRKVSQEIAEDLSGALKCPSYCTGSCAVEPAIRAAT